MQIDLRRLNGFMPKPERNHGLIDAMVYALSNLGLSSKEAQDMLYDANQLAAAINLLLSGELASEGSVRT